jgi:hypothetical protein
MRDDTSPNTRRAKQAQPQKCLEGTPFFECAGGVGPGLIVRDATLRGGALSRLLVDCDAAEPVVDVLCTRGITLSQDRLSLRHGSSGLVGRVPESGHTAGEPIVPERNSHPPPAGAPALQTGTDLRQVFMGADKAPRVANLAGRGDAATVGDVAAGESRGVARVAG